VQLWMVMVVGGLVGVGAGRCAVEVVLVAWVRDPSAYAMAAAAAVVALSGGIAALLPHSCSGLVDGAVPGETHDPCDRTMAAPLCRIPS
jgi:hypothetical protein